MEDLSSKEQLDEIKDGLDNCNKKLDNLLSRLSVLEEKMGIKQSEPEREVVGRTAAKDSSLQPWLRIMTNRPNKFILDYAVNPRTGEKMPLPNEDKEVKKQEEDLEETYQGIYHSPTLRELIEWSKRAEKKREQQRGEL